MVGHRHAPTARTTDALRSVPMFASCTKKDLGLLAGITKEQEFPEGRALCRQGETGVGLYVVLEGTTKVQVNGRTRRRLGPGAVLGEITVLDQGLRPATVVAETRVRALSIPAWDFRDLLKQEPDLAMRIVEEVCRRLRSVDSSLTL